MLDTDEATTAVRHLATIPRPPLALLVKAAASPNLVVAQEAQFAIDNHLRYCQRQIKAGRRTRLVSAQLTMLAESLAERQSTFSIVDFPWIERTTRKVLQLANRISSGSIPILAAHCEEVLAVVTARISPSAISTNTSDLLNEPSLIALTGDAEGLTTLAAHPWSSHPGISATIPPTSEKTTRTSADLQAHRFSVSLPSLPPSRESDFDVNDQYSMTVPPDGVSDSGWQAQWSHPMLHALPAMPINAAPISGPGNQLRSSEAAVPSERIASIPKGTATADRFHDVESRRLLAKWLVSEGSDVFPLEQELTQRGFGRLSARLVRRLFSDQPEDRLRLVDDVLTEPGVERGHGYYCWPTTRTRTFDWSSLRSWRRRTTRR